MIEQKESVTAFGVCSDPLCPNGGHAARIKVPATLRTVEWQYGDADGDWPDKTTRHVERPMQYLAPEDPDQSKCPACSKPLELSMQDRIRYESRHGFDQAAPINLLRDGKVMAPGAVADHIAANAARKTDGASSEEVTALRAQVELLTKLVAGQQNGNSTPAPEPAPVAAEPAPKTAPRKRPEAAA